MTGVERVGRGTAEHWYTDDQFERQLRNPAHEAVIRRRWAAFAAALSNFYASNDERGPLCVLDAGCGDGINLVGLRSILTGLGRPYHLIAIDLNPVRVERARAAERAAGSIAFGSVTALPFGSRSFDVVLCNHVIEHVPRPQNAVAEIARVLRAGGIAIIGVPNEGCAFARLRNHVLQRSILSATDHVNFFTRRGLSHLLSGADLVVQQVRTGGFFLPHLRLSNFVMGFAAGRAMLDVAGQVIPSQAADLIAVATRKS